MSTQLLSIVTFMPTFAALILALFLRGDDEAAQRNAKWLALITTTVTFLISLFVLFEFAPADTGFQFVVAAQWLMGMEYRLGVDGISLFFVILTTFMMPLVIAASWGIGHRVKEYIIAFLLLETALLGAFMALDLILFYLFVEASLIPLLLIIGIWGGKDSRAAAFRLFLSALFGAVLMLVAMLAMFSDAGTTCIGGCDISLLNHQFNTSPVTIAGTEVAGGAQTLLLMAFLISLAVKLPLWPLHTWFPSALAAAPTAGAMVVAALLVQLGGYGLLRFAVPMFPVGVEVLTPLIMWLAASGIVYAALAALAQDDIKRLLAYVAMAQMGLVTLGIFAGTQQGFDGAIFQMISHGLVTGALFLCVGVLSDRMATQDIDAYGGLISRMPRYALVLMIFAFAVTGMPGTAGFAGHLLILIAVFGAHTGVALTAMAGLVVMAAGVFWLYRRVVLGELIKESLKAISDMTLRERLTFAPLVLMTVVLGLYPALVLDIIGPSVAALVESYDAAIDAATGAE